MVGIGAMSSVRAKFQGGKCNVLSWLKKAFLYHYTHTKFERSEQQLERERWLVPPLIPFNRYMLMPCAVLVQVL